MLFLLTIDPQNLKLEQVHGTLVILFYVRLSSPQLQSHFKENAKISKNSTTQENITISRQNLLYLLKTRKIPTLQQVTGGRIPNLVLKRMLELFLKVPPLKKILEQYRIRKYQNTEGRLQNLYEKENSKPEIKPMIENLQDGLYQLENNEAKGTKLGANIRYEVEGEKCSKTFFEVLERQNMQNQTIFEYNDDNKSIYSSNPKDILKSSKKVY